MRDLQEIGDYIAYQLYAPESAAALMNEIEEAVKRACAFPDSLSPLRDELLRRRGYRKIIVKNYLIFVLPDKQTKTLNVMRVMYYARDYLREL